MFDAIIIHVAANWQLRPYVDIPHMCSRPLGSRKGLHYECQYILPHNILLKTFEPCCSVYARKYISWWLILIDKNETCIIDDL
jgi:hypothetical protein